MSGLQGLGQSVLSILPDRFDAYARVFHPARMIDGRIVSWSEIAAANGKEAHAGMQLGALTGIESQDDPQPGVFDVAPAVGRLEPEISGTLAATLARHTTTPDRCFFAVWYGFGTLRHDMLGAPTFTAPGREYLLLTGPVDAVVQNFTDPSPVPVFPSFFVQSPNLWWPEDRAWCVATEIDLNSTYIGCSTACCDDLLELDVEAFAIDPSTGIDYRSDLRNGCPPAPRPFV